MDDMTLYGMVKWRVFILDIRKNSQRDLESSEQREKNSRLNMTCKLDLAMREAGTGVWGGGGREKGRRETAMDNGEVKKEE